MINLGVKSKNTRKAIKGKLAYIEGDDDVAYAGTSRRVKQGGRFIDSTID